MAASKRVGRVDGRVAGLAEESVVCGAVPTGTLTDATVAGSGGLAAHCVGYVFG